MDEIWKQAIDKDGSPLEGYEVSNLGRVGSWKPRNQHSLAPIDRRILGLSCDPIGRLAVGLSPKSGKKIYRVHLLVAFTFLGPRPEGLDVCHSDGNPSNNRLDNLRYDTKSENQKDRVKHGTSNRGERCGSAKLTKDQVRQIHSLYQGRGNGPSQRELALRFAVSQSEISKIISGKAWNYT